MLGEVFYWIFNMSLTASVTVCLLLLLRRFRAIPRRMISFLWFVPMIRFVLVVGITSEISIMSLLNKLSTKTVIRLVPVFAGENDGVFTAMNCVQGAVSYHPIVYRTNVIAGIFSVAAVIWAIGAAALLLTFWILYFTTKRELRDSVLISNNIYYSHKIDTPAVYGILCPSIILPAALRDGDNRFVLLHERSHIRRMDNLRRMAAFSVAALHWFNPMAWIFLRCYITDLELACDESVLSQCSQMERKEYALALLDYAAHKNVFISAFVGASVRLRLSHIMNYRNLTWLTGTIFVILCTVIFCALLTNPN